MLFGTIGNLISSTNRVAYWFGRKPSGVSKVGSCGGGIISAGCWSVCGGSFSSPFPIILSLSLPVISVASRVLPCYFPLASLGQAEENFEFFVGASGDPVRPTYGLAWSQSLAQSENLLPVPELPLIHLDSPYNREGQLPRPASPPVFPLRSRTADEHVPLMKRVMDITGSLIAFVLLPPVLLVIALAIKLTSKGLSFLGRRGSDNMANSLSFPPVSFLNRPRMNL
jgi:hypothetical protein